MPEPPAMPPPPPPSPGKGKGKSRSQYCPHCWSKVKTGGGTAGLSQHMWANERCLAWQQYGDGTRCSWEEAVDRAHELKQRRERETVEEYGPETTVPARSLKHRQSMEAESRRPQTEVADVPRDRQEPEKRRRRKHGSRRRRPSPSPEARPVRKSRKPPSSDDESDRETGPAKRRSARDSVWIQVPMSALTGR